MDVIEAKTLRRLYHCTQPHNVILLHILCIKLAVCKTHCVVLFFEGAMLRLVYMFAVLMH